MLIVAGDNAAAILYHLLYSLPYHASHHSMFAAYDGLTLMLMTSRDRICHQAIYQYQWNDALQRMMVIIHDHYHFQTLRMTTTTMMMIGRMRVI
jgi:hypothetical protein